MIHTIGNMSLPTRGEWIEIRGNFGANKPIYVSPRMGRVD